MRSCFTSGWMPLVIYSGGKSRYSMSLSRFLNICRPFSAEWTSIILTLPAQIWEGEEERDKDESVTRERKNGKAERQKESARHISSHPHPTSRHAWIATVWAERKAGGKERVGEGCGTVGSVRDGGGYVPSRPALIPSSPPSIIQQGPNPPPPPAAQSPRARHRRKDTTRRGGRDKDTPLQPPKTPHTPQTVGQKMPGVNSEMHYSSLTIS